MDIKEFKEKTKPYPDGSLIRKYTNGYQAHYIDMHPHGKTYRKRDNETYSWAFPEEKIMLLTRDGVVVVFLEELSNLEEIEKSMHLCAVPNNT